MPIRYLILPDDAGGPVTHTTSGALTGPGSSLAGTADHKTLHATSGALVGQGSTLSGAAVHPHTTTGVLTGPGSIIVGTAARLNSHATSGALVGPGSALAGVAERSSPGIHATTGALVGSGSSLAGTATRFALHTSSGVLVGPGSVVSGASEHSGDLHGFTQDQLDFLVAYMEANMAFPTPADIAAAILAAAQVTPIHSNVQAVNDYTVKGSGTESDPWNPV